MSRSSPRGAEPGRKVPDGVLQHGHRHELGRPGPPPVTVARLAERLQVDPAVLPGTASGSRLVPAICVHDRLTDRLPAEDQHLKVWRAAGLLAVDAAVSVSPGPLTAADLWAASRVGRPVLWTAWGRDWSDRATPASVLGTVTSGKVDGGTVLLHDSDCTSAPGAWRSAYGALPALFAWCADRGLTVGPLGIHYGTG